MATTYKYRVIAYRQTKNKSAPLLLSFVVPAEELMEWAGIPRRADDRLIGFQRPDDPVRVASAQDFFNTGPNQSPTSLIIGIHPGTQQINLQLDGDDSQELRTGTLSVIADTKTIELDAIVNRVRHQLEGRLLPEDDDSVEGQLDDPSTSDAIIEETPGISDTEEEVEDNEVELGSSILSRLLERLTDNAWVERNEYHLREMAKSATVIDGQHRLLGAGKCERRIPFQVCALYDCPWQEQVFQFTIVNYKQKGIPDQFITANAALSLTKSELEDLQDRLVQANVKVVEYELMKTVQFDERSPFHNLVNLSEKQDPKLIGYKTMVRIANGWYQANAPFFNLLLTSLYPDISGKGAKTQRKERWKNEDWSEFFLDYWNAVEQHYGSTPSHDPGYFLWDVGHSQLIVAVVLLEFQDIFFQSLSDQDEEFYEVNDSERPLEVLRTKLRKRAQKLFEMFPTELFSTKWKEHSLNTGAGRSALRQVFDEMKKNKGAWNWKNSALVKGQS